MKLLLLPTFIFLFGSLFIPLIRKQLARKIFILSISVLGLINVFLIKPGTILKFKFLDFTIIPLYADKLSLIVAYIFVIIAFFALLYTWHVKESGHHILALWYVGTSLGAVFAGDFLTLYIFWELMTVASTGLVLLNKDKEARLAAYRYFMMHLIGGLFLLGGIWLYYLDSGSLLITQLKTGLPFTLLLIGIGVNAGFMLIHTWLPDTYPKASYTASIFMSVFTTKTAVYLLARTAPAWEVIAYIGAATALFGVTMALMQGSGRKLLSYHIISQVGYMIAAIGIGSGIGVDGAIYHLINNVLYKTLLFMSIGAVIHTVGHENLSNLGGLARKMPITATATVVASLSITGIPLFNGFISKGLIFEAAHSYDTIYLLLELAAIGTLLSFLKFTYYAFFKPNEKLERQAKEAPINMTLAMSGIAILSFITGAFPDIITRLLPFGSKAHFFNTESLMGIFQLAGVSVVGFVLGSKRIFVPHNRLTFDLDLLYIKVIQSLELIPKYFSKLNDWFETTAEKIPYYLGLAKKPILISVNYLSDLLFAIWVDFWLIKPTAEIYSEGAKKDSKLPLIDSVFFKPFNWIIVLLGHAGNALSRIASHIDKLVVDRTAQEAANVLFSSEVVTPLKKFESKVVDGLADQAATALYGNAMSSLARLFDKIVVDGVVNGIAKVIFFVGERARRIQTGFVQNYALIIVFVVAILIFMLSIKGGLS